MDWTSRLAEFVVDWEFLLQRDGAASALSTFLVEAARLPYRRMNFLVLARSLTSPLPDIQPKIPLAIRAFEAGDLAFVRQHYRPSEANLCASRLECGHTGLVALHQGQPVGYAWACGQINPETDRFPESLEAGDVLCVDAYTIPPFRNQGVQTALNLARCRWFARLGYRRVIADIEPHNLPSLATWRKIGAQQVGEMVFERIGPRRRSYAREARAGLAWE